MSETSQPAPPEDYSENRLRLLEQAFLGFAEADSTDLSPDTREAMSRMGPRDCLHEIAQLEGPLQVDRDLSDARLKYLRLALTRPTFRNRVVRKRDLNDAEHDYVEAIVGKVASVVNASGPAEALVIRQMPSLVDKTTFAVDKPLELKNFAANHLFLLTDTALKEHLARRHTIDRVKQRNLSARILGNRALHLGIGVAILGAGLAPDVLTLPHPSEVLTGDLEWGLKATSALIFGIDGPEYIRLRVLDRQHSKRTAELTEQLASEQQLADNALRLAYGSVDYGSSTGFRATTDRFGTDDPKENLHRFHQINSDFEHLRRPYNGDQAIGYAARLLIERETQVDEIVAKNDNPSEQNELYLQLCRHVIEEDLQRMKKGLTITRFRKNIMKLVAVVPVWLFPGAIAQTSETIGISRDVLQEVSQPNEDSPN